jgi:hypothetical protein
MKEQIKLLELGFVESPYLGPPERMKRQKVPQHMKVRVPDTKIRTNGGMET